MSRTKNDHPPTGRPHRILRWARFIVGTAVVTTSIPALLGLVGIGILPEKALFIAVPVYVALVGFALWRLIATPKKMWQNVVLLTMGLVITIVNIYAYGALRATDQFMGSIQQSNAYYIEYAIVAKNSASLTVDSAQTVGIIDTDTLYEAAAKGLAEETSATQQRMSDVTQLTQSLGDDVVELATFRRATYDAFEDTYPDFFHATTILATFKVRAEDMPEPTADTTKPFVLYISGIDTYGDVAEVSRSDVNMLAAINPAKRTMLLVNTPRDYYVQLHGRPGTPDKLTHAGLYGVSTSQQTLSDLYDVDVPYYVRLNFSSLVKMVDVIGDIQVHSDYAFKGFRAGVNTLNSKQALEFARERYSFSDGDRQRGRNQQKVIEAIMAKMTEPQNMLRYSAIMSALQGSLQTNVSQANIAKLARMQLNDMKPWTVESIDVGGTGAMLPTYSAGAQPLYVMIPDEASLSVARTAINAHLQP